MHKYNLLIISIFSIVFANAQNNVSLSNSKYNSADLFSPLFYTSGDQPTRSVTGAPGESYWQNRADYSINVSLNDVKKEISGSVIITYKNNSPISLPFLWLQLDQNLFNKESRGQQRMPATSRSRYGDANSNFQGGFNLKSVKLLSGTDSSNADYIVTDTRMQIRLSNPVKPQGDIVKIRLIIPSVFLNMVPTVSELCLPKTVMFIL
jgi:hypothetical protein